MDWPAKGFSLAAYPQEDPLLMVPLWTPFTSSPGISGEDAQEVLA